MYALTLDLAIVATTASDDSVLEQIIYIPLLIAANIGMLWYLRTMPEPKEKPKKKSRFWFWNW